MLKEVSIDEIINSLEETYVIRGNKTGIIINSAKPITEADRNSICWINPKKQNKRELIEKTQACLIICDNTFKVEDDLLKDKVVIQVENPKLTYLRIVDKYFKDEEKFLIHEKAYIEKEAKIAEDVFIGAFTYVGKSEIGKGTKIYGNCYIYDNVKIGENVIIHAGTVIGADGFGYQRNAEGKMEKFPHIGGVIIEDNVEIGANTCIDRGTLGNTLIKKGAKIDNLVHIAHNVIVGEDAVVIANSMIGGSTIIGDRAWVAPSVSVMNSIEIGENTTLGLGTVVIKSVPANQTYVGYPAKPIKEYVEIQKKIKNL
jgi:UDP-3-O-[3-hydroxymyristoyl] glucosamine N-acyltransferase